MEACSSHCSYLLPLLSRLLHAFYTSQRQEAWYCLCVSVILCHHTGISSPKLACLDILRNISSGQLLVLSSQKHWKTVVRDCVAVILLQLPQPHLQVPLCRRKGDSGAERSQTRRLVVLPDSDYVIMFHPDIWYMFLILKQKLNLFGSR